MNQSSNNDDALRRYPELRQLVAVERAQIQAQLTDTASKLDEGRQFFSAALALLTDGIKGLVEAGAGTERTVLTSANDESGSTLDEGGAAFDLASDTALLAVVLADHGSSRTAMVGDTGIEPVTSSV